MNERLITRTARPVERRMTPLDLGTEALSVLIIITMMAQTWGTAGSGINILLVLAGVALAYKRIENPAILLLLLVYPLFAIASTLWSDAADVTLKYAAQFTVTALGGLVLALLNRRAALPRVVLLGVGLLCIICVFDGQMGPSIKGPVLVGVTGSKNAMAAAANLLFLTSVCVLFDRAQPILLRLVSVAFAAFALQLIVSGESATSLIVLFTSSMLALLFWAVRFIPRNLRILCVALALLIAAPIAAMKDQIEEQSADYIFSTFNKDRTLTGRTYLWQVADQLGADRPTLGWGYKYIWMSGSPASVGMLRSQRIVDPRTFSLHQTYYEAKVDLGYAGLSLLILTLIVGGGAVLFRALIDESWSAKFAAIFIVVFVVKSFTDNLIGPFSVYCAIMFAVSAQSCIWVVALRRNGLRSIDDL